MTFCSAVNYLSNMWQMTLVNELRGLAVCKVEGAPDSNALDRFKDLRLTFDHVRNKKDCTSSAS